MNWSVASFALVETVIGLILLITSGVFYLLGAKRPDSEGQNPTGCLALILLISGAIALWNGLDWFQETTRR